VVDCGAVVRLMGSQDGDDDYDDDPLAFRTMKLGKPRKSINLTVKAARKTERIYVANIVYCGRFFR